MVGLNENNLFETSKVLADTTHNFENFLIFIFVISPFLPHMKSVPHLMTANTFDVSNGLFLCRLLFKTVLISSTSLLQPGRSKLRDIT